MKNRIVFIVFALISAVVQSCDDKEVVDPTTEFNIDFISQTAWEGVFTTEYSDEIQNTTDPFSILFTTDSRGNYEIVSSEKKDTFRGGNYAVDGKLITVTNDNHSFIHGDWMVTKVGENELELKRYLNSKEYRSVLKLTRIY